MFKRKGGGGGKGFLNNFKKTALLGGNITFWGILITFEAPLLLYVVLYTISNIQKNCWHGQNSAPPPSPLAMPVFSLEFLQ